MLRQYGPNVTVKMLDDIKETGYKYATIFAPTISMSDIIVPTVKQRDHRARKTRSLRR